MLNHERRRAARTIGHQELDWIGWVLARNAGMPRAAQRSPERLVQDLATALNLPRRAVRRMVKQVGRADLSRFAPPPGVAPDL